MITRRFNASLLVTLLATLLGVSACGGGSSLGNAGTGGTYTAGVFLPEATFAAKCASPRSGTDPITHAA
jgi:hypothetical protein